MAAIHLIPAMFLHHRSEAVWHRWQASNGLLAERKLSAWKIKKAETLEQTPKDRRQGAIRSGKERRKIAIPPPPGSPVRSGRDRRAGDRRSGGRPLADGF
jgi:hypothetical protein